jgi:cell division protein FtsB
MNAEKRLGTKAQIRAEKERQRRIGTAVFAALVLMVILFSAYFGSSLLSQPQNQTLSQESSQPKAAIVDQLSLTCPNETFIEAATNILKQAGCTVDYIPGRQVTVEFYRNLPADGYKIIILRVHSAGFTSEGQPFLLSMFTSEPYSSTEYVYEQLTDQLGCNSYTRPGEPPYYFGIMPEFVRSSMKGNFQNSIIIMMGCDGMAYQFMAEAFILKGAKAYIGWTASVSARHTDTATISLLQHLLVEKQTIKQAVENTMKEVGPDPAYNSQPAYYPPNAGEYTIKNLEGA